MKHFGIHASRDSWSWGFVEIIIKLNMRGDSKVNLIFKILVEESIESGKYRLKIYFKKRHNF